MLLCYGASVLQEYTFNYAEKNKADLEKKGFDIFFTKFDVTDDMLNDLVAARIITDENHTQRDSCERGR